MNSGKIPLLIISIILIYNSPINYPFNIEVRESYSVDKEKRELFRKLKVKTETEVKVKTGGNSEGKSIYIYKNYYDKSGNNKRYEFYRDSVSSRPYYQIDFVTDENGNILEAYRSGKLSATQEFDEKGNMTELINYDDEGEDKTTYEYEYDEMGNITLEVQYLYGDLIETSEYNAYEYISISGKQLIKSKTSLLKNPVSGWKTLYEYDSLGRLIFYQEYKADHKLWMEKYRNYNLQTGYTKFLNPYGMTETADSVKLDAAGNVVEMNVYDDKGNLKEKNAYKYDAKGNRIEQKIDSGGNLTLLIWKFDESGNELEFRKFENGSIKYTRTSIYSDKGLLLKRIEQDEVELHTYEYY